MSEPSFTTDCVVIGSGPAGGALGAFLGSYGIKGIMISKLSTTAESPRAHITNMATMEVLRDFGTNWYQSLAGEEYARFPAWGNGPEAQLEYQRASPCDMCDIAQTLMEPILQRKAVTSGFICRFNTELVSFEQSEGHVDVRVRDRIFNAEYTIRTQYLFGADGARSRIAGALDLPFVHGEGRGTNVWNLLVEADLSHLVAHRNGNLQWTFQQDHLNKDFVWAVHPRMVHPYHQWVVGFFVAPGTHPANEAEATEADWVKRIHQFIGDERVEVKILQKSKWQLNQSFATQYSKGRVFCLGDAVHRHTPGGGLGSNTSIQHSYNLAWKVAHVLKGLAGPSLLETYSVERQPIGAHVTKSAMEAVFKHMAIWDTFGQNSPSIESVNQRIEELSEASPQGRELRRRLREAIGATRYEHCGIGIELNQHYRSDATYIADEGPAPVIHEPLLHYEKRKYPGWRLPHAWLNKAKPTKPISTMDLAGKGAFASTKAVGETLGLEIAAYSIGFRQDWEDPEWEWERLREVDEDGCVLVRPDRFVAWRSKALLPNCQTKLLEVMRHVLCLGRLQ
ncbi:FAD binding domain-containing protein [Aspergillus carlsbadensis]|nr:FAD binding domain-containing protein [Aspergillus carlsbadensis]